MTFMSVNKYVKTKFQKISPRQNRKTQLKPVN